MCETAVKRLRNLIFSQIVCKQYRTVFQKLYVKFELILRTNLKHSVK